MALLVKPRDLQAGSDDILYSGLAAICDPQNVDMSCTHLWDPHLDIASSYDPGGGAGWRQVSSLHRISDRRFLRRKTEANRPDVLSLLELGNLSMRKS